MSENRMIHVLRAMAWQRAKGEMWSMAETYYADQDGDKYDRFKEACEAFIEKVEGDGLQE